VTPLAQATETTLEAIRENIAEIQRTISTLQHLSSGTLLKRTKMCGNPRCRCHSDRAARHGPYYEWGYLKGGKLRHRTLSPQQAELMRLAIANHRKVKKLLKAWEAQTVRLIELNASQ
jgi:hypothetical protein